MRRMIMVENQDIHDAILAIMESMRLQETSPGRFKNFENAYNVFDVRFSITPHVFRHSKSVHLLQSGVNLVYIRDFLGHSDCSTTQIYAKADTETRRKALEAAYIDILPTTELPHWSDDKNLMNFLISLGRQ
jgi:site-specific recombinase XerD